MAETKQAAAYPWAPASATGVGSMPGTDPAEAMRVILGELPDLPHLPELPARGAGAGLIGRTAAMLVDMPVELTPGGWRFTARPGRDLRRARDLLTSDLDTLEEFAQGYHGPLKLQAAGPWTLAASIELARSQDPALADSGAVADLTGSLAEGLRAQLDQLGKRVPGARVLLQLDEPALPGVAAGGIRSASGLRRLPPPEAADLEARLRTVLSAAATFSVVHCCAKDFPFTMINAAGADAVSFDVAQLGQGGEDSLAETVEAGLGILAGVLPASGAPGQLPPPPAVARQVLALWQRMGWPSAPGQGRAGLAGQVVLTPACGLAGAQPGYAIQALARCRDAARLLPELIEEAE